MSSSCSDSEYVQDDFVESDTINEEDSARNRDSPDLFEAQFDSSEDDDFQIGSMVDSSSLESDEEDASTDNIQEVICHLEGDEFLAQANGDAKLAGIVGGLVHLRETQRVTVRIWGNMWKTLFHQNEKMIKITQSILEEVRKRPAVTREIPPAKTSKNIRGKAKVPKDCSVSFVA